MRPVVTCFKNWESRTLSRLSSFKTHLYSNTTIWSLQDLSCVSSTFQATDVFFFTFLKRKKCIVKNSHVDVDHVWNTRDRLTLHITHKHWVYKKKRKENSCSSNCFFVFFYQKRKHRDIKSPICAAATKQPCKVHRYNYEMSFQCLI